MDKKDKMDKYGQKVDKMDKCCQNGQNELWTKSGQKWTKCCQNGQMLSIWTKMDKGDKK